MSEAPKAHVYEPTTQDGHCAECGHHLEASWHYVKGADHSSLCERVEVLERERDDLDKQNEELGVEGERLLVMLQEAEAERDELRVVLAEPAYDALEHHG